MLPSSGYRTKSVIKFAKLAHVPNCTLARASYVRVSKSQIKATRSHGSILANQKSLLLLAVFLVG